MSNDFKSKSKFLKSLESNSIVVKIAKNQLEIKSETEFLQSHDQVKDNASANWKRDERLRLYEVIPE